MELKLDWKESETEGSETEDKKSCQRERLVETRATSITLIFLIKSNYLNQYKKLSKPK
jgi:hypothetical protein